MEALLRSLLVGIVAVGGLHAQKGATKGDLRLDPYTRNERESMDAAGYETIGNMPWTGGHSTYDIEGALGGPPLLWLETEHFRIGCSLSAYTIDSGDSVEKKKLRAELLRLRERLPRIPRKTKVLDPWLRLHLFAMRAEDLYAQIRTLLQVEDDDFPLSSEHGPAYNLRGFGPYLGMRNKFTLLLTEKKSTLARYGTTFCGVKTPGPIMYHFDRDGVLLFGLASEMDNMGSDTTMHCMVTYGLTINLLNGYLAFRHSIPPWLNVGLAHWNARQIDQQRNYFSSQRVFGRDDKDIWDWEVRVRGRVVNQADPDFLKMTGWPDHQSLSFTDLMVSWARVDYLRKEHPSELAEFLRVVKAPFPSGVNPTLETLQAHQIDAFQAVLGMDPKEFDEAWRVWISKNYRRK